MKNPEYRAVTQTYAEHIAKEEKHKQSKRFASDKEFWRNQEQCGYLYTAAENEEPVIPEYNYVKVSAEIAEIDKKIGFDYSKW